MSGSEKKKAAGSLLGLRRIAGNTVWLLADRVYRMGVGLAVGIWIARHLGPETFGVLSYAIAFAGLFGSLAYLGLDGIVTRELVSAREEDEDLASVLGTAAVLRLLGAVAGMLIAAGAAFAFADPGQQERALLVAIVAAGMLFQSLDCVDFFFQSRLESRFTATARSLALTAGAAIKVTLILIDAPLWAFAAAFAADIALRAAGLALIYTLQGGRLLRWRFHGTRARALLKESWPLLLSSTAASIYLKIDQIMLGNMLDEHAVGIYAVAVRLSEVWYFIPAAVAASLLPGLVQTRAEDYPRYQARLQRSYNVLLAMGLGVALPVALVARPVVALLYGEAYADAGSILALHIWACPAIFLGAVLSKWLVAERYTIFSLTRHSLGATTNVALNLYLIPRYGGIGAAAATVVAYSVACFGATFVDRRTWEAGRMMATAAVQLLKNPARAVLGRA